MDSRVESLQYLRRHFSDLESFELKEHSDLIAEERQTLSDVENMHKASEVMREVQDRLSKNTIEYLNNFLTRGIHVVYPNRNLTVVIEIGDRGSRKTAEIVVVDGDVYPQVRVPVNEGTGGGLRVVIAFLLQVLVILNRDLQRIVFLDESFVQVSHDYTEGLFDLFEMLIEEFQFKILLVTHDKRFVEKADKVYQVDKGKIRELR